MPRWQRDPERPYVRIQPSGCWEWQRGRNGKGYGALSRLGEAVAHRVTYRLFKGEIPKGLELDHLCRNPACVNPDHLEPVTHAENCARGRAFMPKRTHCLRGHPFTPENTNQRPGGPRVCRTCKRELKRLERERMYLRQRAERDAAYAALMGDAAA